MFNFLWISIFKIMNIRYLIFGQIKGSLLSLISIQKVKNEEESIKPYLVCKNDF